jgi:hypothetical protein
VPDPGPVEFPLADGRATVTLTGDSPSPVSVAPAAAAPGGTSVTGAATLVAVVIGLLIGAIYRQGAFYPLDAFGLVVVSVPLAAMALPRNLDRRGVAVTLALGALALWWFVRALMEKDPVAFLPLGASVLGFLASFLVVRSLGRRDRSRVAMAVVAIGTATAAAGLVGVVAHWHPLAQQAGGVWRMSTTLTYPAGAAVLFIVALLGAMALDLHAPLPRAAVCLCLAGLVATQSHWDLLALACAAPVVPARRWIEALWPLALGSLAGLAAMATTTAARPSWLPGAAVAVAVAASMLSRRTHRPGARHRLGAVGVVVVAGFTVFLMVRPPVGASPPQATDQGQTLAWSASTESWRSSVVTGVGPPRIDTAHDSVDTYPGFVPDGYLTITADGGLVGAVLLVGAVGAVAAAVRRRDLVSSCATAGLVAFAVAGAVDFDWQLPALALLGGALAGLASGSPVGSAAAESAGSGGSVGSVGAPGSGTGGSPGRLPAGAMVAGLVAVVVLVMTVQLLVGAAQEASGAARVQSPVPPPPSATPEAPARLILTGPYDNTDPFMFKHRGRYYLYTSEGTTFMNVPLRIGSRPGRWGKPVDVLPRLPGWAEGGLTWAPDVHAVSGGWALYFTALLRGVVPYTHCIGAAFARSPSGPFVPTGHAFICQLDHRGSIDARIFVASGGHLVMLWKSEDNANPSVPGPDQNGVTGIYAQDLSSDGRVLLGRPVKIFAPSQPWEGTIVEAPDMIEAWGTYWLFFSGSWYYSTSYGIGVAACQSPFGPCSDPDPRPFIGTNRQGVGPGEQSLFRDGDNVYLLYNPFRANDPGPVIPRPVAMTRLGFTPQGPYLAAP